MSQEFHVPELGESVKSATVATVLVSKGDTIKREQPVVELETDKAVLEVPSDIEGTVDEVLVKEGDEVGIGQTLFTVSAKDGGQQTGVRPQEPASEGREEETEKPAAPSAPVPVPGETVPAAPSVRRFAREIGIDVRTVAGSGPGGRISMADVKTHARSREAENRAAAPVPPAGEAIALPEFSRWGQTEREPMTRGRRLTAERMLYAWSVIPHVTQFGRADVTEMERLRQQYKDDAEKAGGHLTLMAIVAKTVAGALKAFPRFNTSVDAARREIVYRKYCNIGIAMDTERGLLVPVIRDVDKKNMIEVSIELRQITAKAREGKLKIDDLRGGCFTISNAGALGGDTFTPIINWPEVAILGMARTCMEAVYREGEFKPRLVLPLCLSFDHRVIDGADGVRFLQWIVEALEEPVKLLWEG